MEFGLERIKKLCLLCKNPHLKIPQFVHVAGTNGKGTTCFTLASLLSQVSKKRVGLFTSPHLYTPRDCIRLMPNVVSESLYQRVSLTVQAINERNEVKATTFERLVATALLIFSGSKHFDSIGSEETFLGSSKQWEGGGWEGVEVAVVECGLGGLLDATNIHPHPALTILTNIDYDHVELLGPTLLEITRHKCGILRPAVPLIMAPQSELVKEEIYGQAERIKSGPVIEVEVVEEGRVRRINQETAITAWKYLTRSIKTQKEVEEEMLEKLEFPGRMTFVHPGLLVDGAHNASAVAALFSYLRANCTTKERTFVMALSRKGKAMEEILKNCQFRPNDKVICTRFEAVEDMPWVSALNVEELALALKKHGVAQVITAQTIPQALAMTQNEELVVVFGSLYLAGQVLKYYNYPN